MISDNWFILELSARSQMENLVSTDLDKSKINLKRTHHLKKS